MPELKKYMARWVSWDDDSITNVLVRASNLEEARNKVTELDGSGYCNVIYEIHFDYTE